MKKTSKMFISVAMVAFALLSCNDTGINSSGGDDSKISVAKGGGQNNRNDPAPVIIEDDVQKWMEEQLASKGSEKRRIDISDMYLSTNDSNAPKLSTSATIDSNGKVKVKYFLDGKEISVEEYNRLYEKKQDISCRRDLDIPGEIFSSPENCRNWMVLMTAEDIAELLSKGYDNLLISFLKDNQSLPAPLPVPRDVGPVYCCPHPSCYKGGPCVQICVSPVEVCKPCTTEHIYCTLECIPQYDCPTE